LINQTFGVSFNAKELSLYSIHKRCHTNLETYLLEKEKNAEEKLSFQEKLSIVA
jgi:hypothetical protein